MWEGLSFGPDAGEVEVADPFEDEEDPIHSPGLE
jgi:hypothetical protein